MISMMASQRAPGIFACSKNWAVLRMFARQKRANRLRETGIEHLAMRMVAVSVYDGHEGGRSSYRALKLAAALVMANSKGRLRTPVS